MTTASLREFKNNLSKVMRSSQDRPLLITKRQTRAVLSHAEDTRPRACCIQTRDLEVIVEVSRAAADGA